MALSSIIELFTAGIGTEHKVVADLGIAASVKCVGIAIKVDVEIAETIMDDGLADYHDTTKPTCLN